MANNKIKGYYVEFRITPVEHYENEVNRRIDDTENDCAIVLVATEEEIEEKLREYMKSHAYYNPKQIPGGYITYELEITEVTPNKEFNPDWETDMLVIS